MALIYCSECGKEISDKALYCISCGCPINLVNENITEAKCSYCGELNNTQAEYCRKCNIRLIPYKQNEDKKINEQEMQKCNISKQSAFATRDSKKDQRNFFMKHKILTVILALFVLGIIGNMRENKDDSTASKETESKKEATTTVSKTVEPVEEVTEITSNDLIKAYEDNEVKADKEYKDDEVLITGEIAEIGVSFGQTYILLSSDDDYEFIMLQCFFKKQEEIDKIAELSKGDIVSVQGLVAGKIIHISINDCVFK